MVDDAIHFPKFQFTPHALIERLIREIIIEVIKEQTSQTWLVSMVMFMEGILFCRYSSRSRFLMSVVGIRSLSTSKKSTGWPLFTKYNSTMFFLICNSNIYVWHCMQVEIIVTIQRALVLRKTTFIVQSSKVIIFSIYMYLTIYECQMVILGEQNKKFSNNIFIITKVMSIDWLF